jgi:hypothetical protein
VTGPLLNAAVPKSKKAGKKQQRIEKDDRSSHVTNCRLSRHPICDLSVSPMMSS